MLKAVLKLSYKPESLEKHKSIWQQQHCVNGVMSHRAKMDAPMDRAVRKVDGSLPQLTITQPTITQLTITQLTITQPTITQLPITQFTITLLISHSGIRNHAL